jgi:hypothetical protein
LIFMGEVAAAVAGAGAVAGLAVALPLGAIGVPLIQESITAGRRSPGLGSVSGRGS